MSAMQEGENSKGKDVLGDMAVLSMYTQQTGLCLYPSKEGFKEKPMVWPFETMVSQRSQIAL